MLRVLNKKNLAIVWALNTFGSFPLIAGELEKMLEQGRRVAPVNGKLDSNFSFQSSNKSFTSGAVYTVSRDEAGAVTLVTFDTNLMPSIKKSELEQYSRAFLDEQAGEFAFGANDLFAHQRFFIELTEKVSTLNFYRKFAGIDVRDSHIEMSFHKVAPDEYRLRQIVNRGYGPITIANANALQSTFADLQAAAGSAKLEFVSSRRLIVVKDEHTSIQAERNFVLATEFKVIDLSADEELTITLEDGRGEILEAFSRKVFGSTLKGKVYKRGYLDGAFVDKPLPLTEIVVNDESMTTDADGSVDVDLDGTAKVTLNSPRVRVRVSNSGSNYSFNAALNTDAQITVQGNDLNALNSYLAIHEVNKFVRRHLKPSESSLLGRSINVSINVSGSCNAFYNGSISLYGAGGGCANMAVVNDVIYHEWGHGLDDSTGQGGISDGAFSEGIGDIVAAYINNSSNMAPGFQQGRSQGIRQLKNTKKYPNDRGEVHAEGEIIGGAFWDLREALIARYGAVKGAYVAERLFFRHLLTTDSYRSSYETVLSLDDDDGNPATASPNKCLIAKAFKNHGLSSLADCVDETDADPVGVDSQIVVGVKESSSNGAVLMASMEKAYEVGLCFGERKECLETSRIDIEFEFEGVGDNDRLFFVSKGAVSIQDQMVVTIIAMDKGGKAIGARSMKIATK